MTRHQSLDAFVASRLTSDAAIESYLHTALEEYRRDHDYQALLVALRQIARAKGGVSAVAATSGHSRTSLYKALSGQRSPRLDTFTGVLHSLGYELDIRPISG
jgi:probable addiction module antidote protein